MNEDSRDYNLKNAKQLADLFKEVQDIRYGRARAKQFEEQEQIKFNRIYVVNKKFNAIGAVIGILFLILFATSIKSNYIFATTEEEKVPINTFEENENTIDIMGVLSNNISELTKKEIITTQIETQYETEYIENNQLPKGEEKTIQEGVMGFKEQTIIKTYENDEVVDENIISEIIISEPVNLIIEKGTSEFLYEKKVHIGDKMFTTVDTNLYESPEENNNIICMIYGDIDVELLEENNGWAKVSIDGMEGYVKGEDLTSEALTPGISEIARKKRIKLSVNIDMPLNQVSGLTREDFKKILSGDSRDINHIFEDNATAFYEAEQKYNINGVFLASIAIHESGWGTSNIAMQKKNLFGYGSYDASAFESSYMFESYQYGIELVAKSLVKNYLNPAGTEIYNGESATGSFYNGPTVTGVNTRYASDQGWAQKVYDTMVSLYDNL